MKISPTFIVLLIEFAAVLTVIIGVFAFVSFRRNRLVSVAVRRATTQKAAAEPARQEELYATLREALAGEDEVIKQKAEQIIQSERVFHDRILTAFRTRDKEAIDKLDNWTEELVRPYRSLISEVSAPEDDETKAISEKLSEMEETVEALTAERDRVKEQLKNKEKEVESMVGEYVSAFNEKGAADADKAPNDAISAGDTAATEDRQPDPAQASTPTLPDTPAVTSTNDAPEKAAAVAGNDNTGASTNRTVATDDSDLDEEIEAFLEATEQPDEAVTPAGEAQEDREPTPERAVKTEPKS